MRELVGEELPESEEGDERQEESVELDGQGRARSSWNLRARKT